MASRKQQQDRVRLQTFAGVVAIAVVIVAVVVAIASGGSSAGGPGGLQRGRQLAVTERAVSTLLSGIPQRGTVLGRPSAKVTLTYYGDLECPACRAFTLLVLPGFVQQQVRTGRVKLDYRSLCTATCGASLSAEAAQRLFTEQQVAAYAAGRQDRFWNYAELFYHEQGPEDSGYVTDHYLGTLARQAGVNLQRWRRDRTDPALAAAVAAEESAAAHAGIGLTPTLIMRGPRGEQHVTGTYGDYDFPGSGALAAAVRAVSR